MQLEKHDYILSLFDFYNGLLTEKQKKYFQDYYFDDLSISEIASIYDLSRNAIFDQLKKTEEKLLSFEKSLKLYEKTKKIAEILEDSEYLDKVLDIIKE